MKLMVPQKLVNYILVRRSSLISKGCREVALCSLAGIARGGYNTGINCLSVSSIGHVIPAFTARPRTNLEKITYSENMRFQVWRNVTCALNKGFTRYVSETEKKWSSINLSEEVNEERVYHWRSVCLISTPG